MKRKFIIFWTMIMALFLMLTACSGSGPKDSDVEEDICTFGKGKFWKKMRPSQRLKSKIAIPTKSRKRTRY